MYASASTVADTAAASFVRNRANRSCAHVARTPDSDVDVLRWF